MSNGACQTACQDSYAFAVLQGDNCWCSNYIPPVAEQVITYECNQVCPGFKTEWCGNSASGLFGYYGLSKPPSGTAGAASSAAPTIQASSVSTTPSTRRYPSPPSSSVDTTPSSGASIRTLMPLSSVQRSVQTPSSVVESSVVVIVPVSTATSSSTTV